jgi:hypothetical protein
MVGALIGLAAHGLLAFVVVVLLTGLPLGSG